MKIKDRLISWYENIYASNLFLSRVYLKQNRNNRLKVMTSNETIKYIQKKECSVARFGEGEFELMLYPDINLGFQKHSDELSERLKEVLKNNNDRLLICIPYALNSIWGRTKHSRMFWYSWGNYNNQHHRIVEVIRQCKGGDYVFGDTQITRPYVAYKNSKNAKKIFPQLKKLWDRKDIIVVEGKQTRLGIGNDLFENVKSIKRILAPAVNAFDCYEEIMQAVISIYQGELIVLALGPTATVLACDFANQDMRALDLGHVDIEYEWFLRGDMGHDAVVGKYTNEADGGNIVEDCLDEIYLNQIVKKIGE